MSMDSLKYRWTHSVGVAVIAALGAMGSASASTIFSATGATINSGGPGFGSIDDTFNQAGLLTGYTSGVTNFNTYIAGNPQHNLVFAGNEWFSNSPTTSAIVTYDLGASMSFDAIALWNEDISGIGLLDLLTSSDDVTYSALVSGLAPTNNADNVNYGADVFSFAAVTARYVRFDMSRCPQTAGNFESCAIGEVAFRAAENGIPEPATLALVGMALAGLGWSRRRSPV